MKISNSNWDLMDIWQNSFLQMVQAYDPTHFGETKNGVWIPKDPSGLTYGNNGLYLKFENASDLGNDSSGNNNDFTVIMQEQTIKFLIAQHLVVNMKGYTNMASSGNFCT